MVINNKFKQKFKWYLLTVIGTFIAILALSLNSAGTAIAREGKSFADAQKVAKTESRESLAPSNSCVTGIPVRCYVIVDE